VKPEVDETLFKAWRRKGGGEEREDKWVREKMRERRAERVV